MSSLETAQPLPSTCTASSDALRWESVSVREYEDPQTKVVFTVPPSPDLLVVINLGGSLEIELEGPGGPRRATCGPAAVGLAAPGRTMTLRRDGGASARGRSLHLHLRAHLLRATAESLGDPFLWGEVPDALLSDDPVVRAIGRGLREALEQRSEARHADALARSLALHLLWGHRLTGHGRRTGSSPTTSTGTVASQVHDFMQDHLAEKISLDDLSREVSVSKFHLLRLFARETGQTPHRHLTRLRMERAAEMLRDSDTAVYLIADECGYRSAGQFARVFVRHFGVAPSRFRQQKTGR